MGKRLSQGERIGRALDNAASKGVRLEAATARKMIEDLRAYRAGLVDRIASANTFEIRRLGDLQDAIEKLTDRLEEQLVTGLVDGMKQGFTLATKAASSASQILGVQIGGVGLTPATISAMNALAAQRVLKFSDTIRSRINTSIMRGVLGEKSPFEVIQMIRVDIGGKDNKGQAFWSAERIARTEVGRVQSAAQQERFAQINDRAPGTTGKIWVTEKDVRVRASHVRAGRQYRIGGTPGPIPVEEAFIVGGADLMYPLDPSGPPEEVIECRCRHRIVPLVAVGA